MRYLKTIIQSKQESKLLSIIRILLMCCLKERGEEYYSDKEARKHLTTFIDPGTTTKIQIGDKEYEFSDSYGNGIGVYLVIDIPIQEKKLGDDKVGDEYLIHGIGNIDRGDPQGLMDGLNQESWYYEHYDYETKDYKQIVDFYEYDIAEIEPNKILITPFDWTGYDIPYYDSEKEQILDEEQASSSKTKAKTYQDLINGGENNQVEFKSSLLYYYDKKGGKSGYRMFVRHIIAKTISSFLNSNGGHLFVGVRDNKEIQGLIDDFSLVRPKGKDPKDYFTLEVDKIIKEYFKSLASNISGEFTEINGVEIYVFTVFPSKNRPVFINGQNGKEFYVRLMGSCEPYTDIEEITVYCIDRWGK